MLLNIGFAKRRGGATNREPYASFLKKFNRLNDDLTNQELHLHFQFDPKNPCNFPGFCLDYAYARQFNLRFRYLSLSEDQKGQSEKFCILHAISFQFAGEEYQSMMLETVRDIKKRNSFFYLSSDVKSCEIQCGIEDHNTVTVLFCVYCDRSRAKEVSLQLISHDIALFARSF